MRLSIKALFCIFVGITLLPLQHIFAQSVGSDPYLSTAGQTKAELVGAAFSAYVSGDVLQAQIYLQRARQLDRNDATIQRLLENLTPVATPPISSQFAPVPETPTVVSPVGTEPSAELFQAQPYSANDRARQIAINNGMSPEVADQASQLQPHVPRSVVRPSVSSQSTAPTQSPFLTPALPLPQITPLLPPLREDSDNPSLLPSPVISEVPLTQPDDIDVTVPGIPPPPPVPVPVSNGGSKMNLNGGYSGTGLDPVSEPLSPILPDLPEIISAPEPILYPPTPTPTPVPESTILEPSPLPPPFFHNTPEIPPLTPPSPTLPSEEEVGLVSPEPLQLPPPSEVLTSAASSVSSQERIEELIMEIGLLDAQLLEAQQNGNSVMEQEISSKVSGFRNELKTLEEHLLAKSSPGNKPIEERDSGNDPLTIKVGETIELMILEDESFNGMYEVRLGGYILIPKVGRASVEGMTVQEAEKSIYKLIDETMIKNPSVIVERPNAGKIEDTGGIIYLTGEFKRPGPFTIIRGRVPSVTSVFIHAGGETPKADLSQVRVMRLVNGKNQVEVINLDEIINGNLGRDMILRDGDIVQIPTRQNTDRSDESTSSPVVDQLRTKLEDPVKPTTGRDNGVFVTGRVKSSGFLELENDVKLTAYAAILSRGGFAPFANPRKVYVLRETGGGQKVHIPVDIKLVQLGLEPDVELRTRDIIHVPEKFFSF